MPIYAYQCKSCHHEMEALQKLSDAPLTDCPVCSSPTLAKKVTAAAFRLSGSGWYETDFKKNGQKNINKPDQAGAGAKSPPSTETQTTTSASSGHSCGGGTCPTCS
ncbi:MAG TPA: zinc ribbon domain-containing protein [Thiolinea sp.]|nr:zinc ribbon domain-containing protein [Thiolinea sp.]